ncbi:Oidioi.mRNA.OKI2018_I69.XSR.g15389.t1.cds [Oikopleura dioica]|uniref:Oidioi.mRNA.OKI2018_I69.XSR.g15389.t1.cds n=1 Tax=Oikopleura dioica TaxID=34765 RepID=A0ABN7SGT4_OIKDI|nr:Oidioi.mRNA.OKI2018_I69.XSR.g15389.t1.cds [Oikopleura dioica]
MKQKLKAKLQENIIGLAYLEIASILLLFGAGLTELLIYKNHYALFIQRYLFITFCIAPLFLLPATFLGYRGGRHGLRGPLKAHILAAVACIIFNAASSVILITAYSASGVFNAGPVAEGDNFEVLFKVMMIIGLLVNLSQMLLFIASGYQAYLAIQLWREMSVQKNRMKNYLRKKAEKEASV